MQEMRVQSLGLDDPMEKEMATHPLQYGRALKKPSYLISQKGDQGPGSHKVILLHSERNPSVSVESTFLYVTLFFPFIIPRAF